MKKDGFKIYIETFGCQMNVSDSERMAEKLRVAGHEIVTDEATAEVVVLNTCSVREKAEQKLYTRVGEIRRREKKPLIGVTGCVAQLEGEDIFRRAAGVDFLLGTRAVGRIGEVLERASETSLPQFDLGEREIDYEWTVGAGQRHSPYVAFLPIIEGCNKFCTYCIVPFSRGRETSLSPRLIIQEILKLKKEGYREVHLIGQNVNSYRPKEDADVLKNFTGATPFAKLLRAVAATGFERIKFTTSFPRDFHPDIVRAIEENENLCNWVHLPVQSGSDRILKAMRRGHLIEDYKKRIDSIRNSRREITVTTDIIIGYPGETDSDFQETVRLFEYCRYDSAYIFKYSPRKGTPASALSNDVSEEVKKERFLELEKIQRKHQTRSQENCLGKEFSVLVEKISSKSNDDLTGHTTCHRVVNFRGTSDYLGKVIKVKATESKKNSLYGKIA